jgi:hypothetical protein
MALQQVGGVETKTGISRLTREYLYWRITSNNNVQSASAEVAFVSTVDGRPAENDWTPATIVADPDDATKSAIRLLVGPGGVIDLSPPTDVELTYRVWIRITIGTEQIVRRVGTLLVR